MPVLILRSMSVTEEDAAILRVALAALLERTDVLSPEGRERARLLATRTEEIVDEIVESKRKRGIL